MAKGFRVHRLYGWQLNPGALEHLDRTQWVGQCWRRQDGDWVLKDLGYTEDWNAAKKNSVARALKKNRKGRVFGYRDKGCILAVASVGGKPLESGGQAKRLELELLVVSKELRGKGLGRALFERCARFAKKAGAHRLYISSHSSRETVAFYKAMGCVVTHELDPGLFYKEPFDVHLEFDLANI